MGANFILYKVTDGAPIPICHARECTIEVNTEALEISGPNSYWSDFIGGYCGYTVSCSGLVDYSGEMNLLQLLELQMSRTKFIWMAGDAVPGGVIYGGTILLTRDSVSSPYRDLVAFDASATGCGELTIQKLPIIKEVYLSDLVGVRLPGCPNPYPCMVLWYDGTSIGLANNADEVMTVFNAYEGNQYYQLVGTDTGCNFTMSIAWNSPEQPDWVPAEQGAGFVLGRTGQVGDNDVIGETGQVGDNNVIGPIQTP